MTHTMQSWFSIAKPLTQLEAHIYFVLSDSFYYKPDRRPKQAENRLEHPLTLPRICRKEEYRVRTAEVLGHEEELAAYYMQIVKIMQRHPRKFRDVSQYFWLGLELLNDVENIRISFPWYDTLADMDRFLLALPSLNEQEYFSDEEQSWEINVFAHHDLFYIREGNPDDAEATVIISIPKNTLLSQIAPLRAQANQVISRLSEVLGADVWTQTVWAHNPFPSRETELESDRPC